MAADPGYKVHWDHVGEPRDFTKSLFVVGSGSLDLLHGTSAGLRGGHSFFEADLLDPARTIELSNPSLKEPGNRSSINALDNLQHVSRSIDFSTAWQSLDILGLPSVFDVFHDGSLYIVHAPGHLPGHINLLASISDGRGGTRWLYLAGDACHDRRIMRREKEIGEWEDAEGHVCCIHANRAQAEETIQRIRNLEGKGVEVIFAHDVEWETNSANRHRFFGAVL